MMQTTEINVMETPPPYAESDLRVMSFNLRLDTPHDGPNAWPHRRNMAARVFVDCQVDVAGLQEALPGQIADLHDRLPEYGWIGAGRDDGRCGGEAAPIFYRRDRFAIEKQGTFWLSENPGQIGSIGWDAAFPRVATWAIFHDRTNARRFFFLNTHLDHQGEDARRFGTRLLLEEITRLHEDLPVILTGDFNAKPDAAPVAMVLAHPGLGLQNARRRAKTPHVGGEQSFNGFRPDESDVVIDYIFVSPDIRVREHEYHRIIEHNIFVSDHWPVTARMELPGLD